MLDILLGENMSYVILTSSNDKYEKMKVEELEMVGRIIWSQLHGVKTNIIRKNGMKSIFKIIAN